MMSAEMAWMVAASQAEKRFSLNTLASVQEALTWIIQAMEDSGYPGNAALWYIPGDSPEFALRLPTLSPRPGLTIVWQSSA